MNKEATCEIKYDPYMDFVEALWAHNMLQCPVLKKKKEIKRFHGNSELEWTKEGTNAVLPPMTLLFYISGGFKLS